MSDPVFILDKVNAYYGRGRVLHDVSFEMGREPVALIGRNGMGKTTLCLTIMGLMARADGSVRFEGQELMGRAPYKISGAGIGYVPQGRRLFPSLSTEEHLDMLGAGRGGRWDKAAIWELFPASPSAARSAPPSFRAGSSRCSPSPARSSAIPSF